MWTNPALVQEEEHAQIKQLRAQFIQSKAEFSSKEKRRQQLAIDLNLSQLKGHPIVIYFVCSFM